MLHACYCSNTHHPTSSRLALPPPPGCGSTLGSWLARKPTFHQVGPALASGPSLHQARPSAPKAKHTACRQGPGVAQCVNEGHVFVGGGALQGRPVQPHRDAACMHVQTAPQRTLKPGGKVSGSSDSCRSQPLPPPPVAPPPPLLVPDTASAAA